MTCCIESYLNFSITCSKSAKTILLVACQLVEVAEKEDFEEAPVNLYSEKEDNDTFFNQWLSEKSFSKEKHSNNKEEWDNNNDLYPPQPPQCPCITTCYREPSLFQLYPWW